MIILLSYITNNEINGNVLSAGFALSIYLKCFLDKHIIAMYIDMYLFYVVKKLSIIPHFNIYTRGQSFIYNEIKILEHEQMTLQRYFTV